MAKGGRKKSVTFDHGSHDEHSSSIAGHEEKTLRYLNLFSLIYFVILLLISAFVTYNGSYEEYSRNSTKMLTKTSALEEMRPVISVCRLPGFKMTERGASDLEDILDEEEDKTKHHDLIKESMLSVDDVVLETTLELEDMFAGRKEEMEGGGGGGGWDDHTRVSIGPEQWMEVPSGSRLVGNCFSLYTSSFSSAFNSANGSTIVITFVTPPEEFKPQYIIQAYTEGEESLVGVLSMEEANVLKTIVKSGETGIFNLEMQKTERFTKCHDYTDAASAHTSFDDCMFSFMDDMFPGCTGEMYGNLSCSVDDFRDRTKELFSIKSDGYDEFISNTGCQLPCNRQHFSLTTTFLMDTAATMSVFGKNRSTVAAIRRFQKTSMTVTYEVAEFNLYLLITDIGGVWGLFLGVSFWSVYEWGVRPLSKRIRRKISAST